MNWPTILCASIASASFTLAAMHLVIWAKNRAPANIAFSSLALGVVMFTWTELAMMRAGTTGQFAIALWWTNVAVFVMVAALVAFVRYEFRTARMAIGHLAWLLRFASLVAAFFRYPGSDYARIIAVRRVSFLGQQVTIAEGVTSTWYWVGMAGLLALLWFAADAAYRLSRTGEPHEKRRALVVGVPASIFVFAGAGCAALIFAEVVHWPHIEFVPSLGLLCAIAYELSSDVLRAARLTTELQASEAALLESERRLTIAADTARLAELSAHDLTGRLIGAQEDERRRLARDLHDDLNQRLSLLSVELELLGRTQPDETRSRASELASKVQQLSSDVHRLSYQLHPAKLDQLGLETAARSWCRDVTQQSGVRIRFLATDVPVEIPSDVALCAYRILQEALRNAVRHSGARSAKVELHAGNGRLDLAVTDTGRGFDPATITAKTGLGLLSMRERTHLLHGTIELHSHPTQGTRVAVTIPLPFVADEPAGDQPIRTETRVEA